MKEEAQKKAKDAAAEKMIKERVFTDGLTKKFYKYEAPIFKHGADVYKEISRLTRIPEQMLSVKYEIDKVRTQLVNDTTPMKFPVNLEFIYYKILTDFKDVSFTCQPNGFWTSALLTLCGHTCRDIVSLRKR
jgi:hypothetical protein